MDADLQDPPEMIEAMVEKWREGYEIVYARRAKRRGESLYKKGTSWLFYRILRFLADVEIPPDVGDFRLVDRKVVDAVRQCREHDRFIRGLVAWTGFRSAAIEYDRPERAGGETKYSSVTLLLLSLDAAVGFSILPLRFASAIGFTVTLGSLVLVAVLVAQKVFRQLDIPGYALQTAGLFFLGGVQMLMLGILGEYVGRIYRQSQSRPLYIVRQTIGTPYGADQAVAGGEPMAKCD